MQLLNKAKQTSCKTLGARLQFLGWLCDFVPNMVIILSFINTVHHSSYRLNMNKGDLPTVKLPEAWDHTQKKEKKEFVLVLIGEWETEERLLV